MTLYCHKRRPRRKHLVQDLGRYQMFKMGTVRHSPIMALMGVMWMPR
jgi:hypothetical protein